MGETFLFPTPITFQTEFSEIWYVWNSELSIHIFEANPWRIENHLAEILLERKDLEEIGIVKRLRKLSWNIS